jgi:hypothetical protein
MNAAEEDLTQNTICRRVQLDVVLIYKCVDVNDALPFSIVHSRVIVI